MILFCLIKNDVCQELNYVSDNIMKTVAKNKNYV